MLACGDAFSTTGTSLRMFYDDAVSFVGISQFRHIAMAYVYTLAASAAVRIHYVHYILPSIRFRFLDGTQVPDFS